MDFVNPWSSGNLDEFLYYCCPECDVKDKSTESFLQHALDCHPLSEDYFKTFAKDIAYSHQFKENGKYEERAIEIKEEQNDFMDIKEEIEPENYEDYILDNENLGYDDFHEDNQADSDEDYHPQEESKVPVSKIKRTKKVPENKVTKTFEFQSTFYIPRCE